MLGVILDNKLTWTKHIEKVIAKTKRVCFGLSRLRAYHSPGELLTLATSLAFSKLYYASPVWLNKNLHRVNLQNLLRASTNILKSCFRPGDWNYVSFNDIHKITGKATPLMWSNYCQATALKRIIETKKPENVWLKLQQNCRELRRENCIFFCSGSQTPMGNHNFANRVQHVSYRLPTNWDSLSVYSFKKLSKRLFLAF